MKLIDKYWFNMDEYESYEDKKVDFYDMRFPEHEDKQPSEVTITYINK